MKSWTRETSTLPINNLENVKKDKENNNNKNSTKALKQTQEHMLMEYLAVTTSTCMVCISPLISGLSVSAITSEKDLVVVSEYHWEF